MKIEKMLEETGDNENIMKINKSLLINNKKYAILYKRETQRLLFLVHSI